MKNNNKEIHIIVLYSNARSKQKEILEDISKNLKIIDCIDVEWSKEKILENYSRFYRFKPKATLKKAKECGMKNPLLVVVEDNNPKYEFVEALVGHERCNSNLLNLKFKYREWVGQNAIHSTVNQLEAKRDLCLFLSTSLEDYLKTAPKEWDGKIKSLKQDLAGANGFKNLKEMFYIINETMNYAVLRNYEMLPEDFRLAEHGDIDIIVDNYNIACSMLNAKPKFSNYPKAFNKVGNETIPYDIRHPEDCYYCYNFSKDMLSSRKLNENGVYVLDDEYYFYSLIYHAFIHKYEIAQDYYTKLEDLFYKLGLDKKYNLNDYASPFDLYLKLLHDFMKKNNYEFIKTKWPVNYNTSVLNLNNYMKHIESQYNIKDIKPCKTPDFKPNYKFFDGFMDSQHVFVKIGGSYAKCLKNEFYMMKKLYEINPYNFVKPIYYNIKKYQTIVENYIEGKNLQELIDKKLITDELKDIIVSDIEKIANTLVEAKIINRNIKPTSFILGKDNHIKLIDFRYAVELDNYEEPEGIKEIPDILNKIKNDYTFADLEWDDFYSISKVLDLMNLKSSYIRQNIGKYTLKYDNGYSGMKNILQNAFSIKNELIVNKNGETKKKYKVFRILGAKIRLKRK